MKRGGLTNRQRTRIARIALWIGLVLGAAFAGLPVLWMLSSSLKTNVDMFASPPQLIPPTLTFDAYTSILMDPEKLRFSRTASSWESR